MCNRYHPARAEIIQAQWEFGDLPTGDKSWRPGIGPWGTGPFIRIKDVEPELVVCTWALIGDDDKKPINRPRMTNCARSEELMAKKPYRGPWSRGQRCLIPAERFDYPNWESGKNVWWTLRRSDGDPWGLAGMWNTWIDKATGEVHESYTMLTLNADQHPLMNRMHKPDPKRPPQLQDKRSVIPIGLAEVDAWLFGTSEATASLLKLPATVEINAGPVPALPAVGET